MSNCTKKQSRQPKTLSTGNYAIYEQFCLNTLDPNGFLTINRTLFQAVGLLEAVVLSELISEYKYFKQEHQLQSDGSFYVINEKLQSKLNLTEYRRKQVIASLKSQKLIFTKVRGVPPKTYYHIHFEPLFLILGGERQFGEGRQIESVRANELNQRPSPNQSSDPRRILNKEDKIRERKQNNKEEPTQNFENSKEEKDPPPPKTSQESGEKQTPPASDKNPDETSIPPEIDAAVEEKIIESKIQNVKTYYQNRMSDRWLTRSQAVSQMGEILAPLYKELEQLKQPVCEA